MSQVITRVFVPGRPRTKGSLKPVLVRRGSKVTASLRESGEYSVPWKKTIMRALMRPMLDRLPGAVLEPYAGPVEVNAFFRFERLCEPDRDVELWPWPVRREGEYAHGDVDKLLRNVLDALEQAHVLADDANVVGGRHFKRFCLDSERPGVLIVVTAAGTPEDAIWLEKQFEGQT